MSVWLVGAGCGLPGLLTLSAADILSKADHVVYDRLIHPDILQLAPADCEFHLVGKRENLHTMRQEDINELLVSLGREGGVVVRLKGGDPFVFGRGGEEAEFLEKNGVAWSAIPGVTSAVGGAVASGLPVTHRDVASSLLLTTGHRRADLAGEDDGYWREAAAVDGTVAIYMGAANFAVVADRLIVAGKKPETPVSVVRWAGWNRASRTDGTLAETGAAARRGGLPSPSIIYVGNTANVRLAGERGPLRGMQVVMCRPYPECWNSGRALEALGADCYGLPLLRFEEIEVGADDLAAMTSADWLVITSPRGAARAASLIDVKRAKGKIVAIGEGTASALKSRGIEPSAVADGCSGGLADVIRDMVSPGELVVFARNERGSNAPPAAVRERGGRALAVPTYRMAKNAVPGLEVMREQWESCGVDAVVFGSAALVEAYASAIGEPPESAALVAWGGECAAAIRRVWGREPEIMPSPGVDGLVLSLKKLAGRLLR
jgi:uroporphyrinogen III methyltransferase/synthase